jgi:acetolactate synthase-1/2/3 large subunit
MSERTGADAIVGALASRGVRVCFANPGTSEMHLVSALDRAPDIRSVLCLFEGVASGAADGYARVSGKPAMTLLHLGSGLANAGANLHNARRAFSPIVNLIGDHAREHLQHDAPLTSDIAGLAAPLSVRVLTIDAPGSAAGLAAEAHDAAVGAPHGPVALIVPADCAWSAAAPEAIGLPPQQPVFVPDVAATTAAIRAAKKPVLLLNGSALSEPGLAVAARLSALGIGVFCDTFFAKAARGAGRFAPQRLGYFAEMALAQLAGVDLVVCVETKPLVAFFAYPGRPSLLVPDGAETLTLCPPCTDGVSALSALAHALEAPAAAPMTAERANPPQPSGALSVQGVALALARHMPEHALIADDGVTSGMPIHALTQNAAPHEWMCLSGGAIGIAMPLALGAAIAAPDRKVIALTGDGAGMYTLQSLWTMARENLDVLTLVFANRSYAILNIELSRTGAGNPGPTAQNLLSLDRPTLDWVKLAEGMGVPAVRCTEAEDFDRQLARLLAMAGPKLIEAVL